MAGKQGLITVTEDDMPICHAILYELVTGTIKPAIEQAHVDGLYGAYVQRIETGSPPPVYRWVCRKTRNTFAKGAPVVYLVKIDTVDEANLVLGVKRKVACFKEFFSRTTDKKTYIIDGIGCFLFKHPCRQGFQCGHALGFFEMGCAKEKTIMM